MPIRNIRRSWHHPHSPILRANTIPYPSTTSPPKCRLSPCRLRPGGGQGRVPHHQRPRTQNSLFHIHQRQPRFNSNFTLSGGGCGQTPERGFRTRIPWYGEDGDLNRRFSIVDEVDSRTHNPSDHDAIHGLVAGGWRTVVVPCHQRKISTPPTSWRIQQEHGCASSRRCWSCKGRQRGGGRIFTELERWRVRGERHGRVSQRRDEEASMGTHLRSDWKG